MAYIVVMTTRDGPLCERFETYDAARRRVELYPEASLVGLPLIFEELPDDSQRVVREDGKPLQWHRLPEDPLPGPDEPLPLSEVPPELVNGVRFIDPETGLPLTEGPPSP